MLRMCVYMHSRFVENHPIWILKDGSLISEEVLSQFVQACVGFATRMFDATHAEPEDVVEILSSDMKEALELLCLGSSHEVPSKPSVDNTRELSPSSSAGSDWPKANDMAMSVYVVLTA
jgi:hypothetical protein